MSRKVFDIETILAIGERIRAARGKRKQTDFANEIGVNRSALANYEAGRRLPDIKIIKRIEEASALPSDYIVFGAAHTPIDHIEHKFTSADERWEIAASLHLYERLRSNIRHSDETYTRLWWGPIFEKLIQHFQHQIFDVGERHDVDIDLAARMVMRQIDDTSEEKLMDFVEKLSDE